MDMLKKCPLVPMWKFCDQDLLSTFFGGGGEASSNLGVATEKIGELWMPVQYYYNALRTLR
jgi:hypothetical protein